MRLSSAHDFYPEIEPADAGSLSQAYDTAWEAFIGDPNDAAYDRLQFYARACPAEAASAGVSQARFFKLVRTREWYQSVDPADVTQGFREAVALADRHPGAGPALRHLSATVAMRPALRDAVLNEFPTSVAARVLRSTTVDPPSPPVTLARLIGADFPAGIFRRLPAPARASRPTGPPWGVPCSASPHAEPGPPGEIRTLPRPPWQVHCAGGLPPEGVQR
jgi:hypothetical protein